MLGGKKKDDKRIKNYIDGKFYAPFSDEYFDNYNPSLGKVYNYLPDSDERDVGFAVESAQKAAKEWSKASLEKRSRILMRVADIIEQNVDALALAESEDTGKPIRLAESFDIIKAADIFRFFATGIMHYSSESHYMVETAINYTLRHPVGIVACIVPWHMPLYSLAWKVAPALAAGNCVLAKPSELTPQTALLLAQICTEAGLPAGVLNILYGSGAKVGRAMVMHQAIRGISFTGNTQTGKEIAKMAAPLLKKVSLGLSGKNANIIFADADFKKMLPTTVKAAFNNQGQMCLANSRIFVQRPIYEKFKTEFMAKAYLLRVGDPMDKETHIGALISRDHMDKVLYYIDLAEKEGGKILTGGKRIKPRGRCREGWFIEPTVIENVPLNARINQEEIFGPVVTLTPFDSESEALAYANNSEYGLSATIWTENLDRAHRLASNLECGMVWINGWNIHDFRIPFGGVKNSGLGREGGWEVLRFFTEPKNVCVQI